MLKNLFLENVILVESSSIPFKKGLNIISGESGAGKSAIIHALSCIAGARADSSIIRKDADKATIIATFSDGTTIKREIYQNKPSKAWINDQLVNLSELQNQSHFELIGQGAYHTLKSPAEQLKLLDQIGKTDRLAFSEAYASVLELGPMPNLDEIADIEALQLKPGEEDELFKELDKLSNVGELTEKAQTLIQGLTQITAELGKLSRTATDLGDHESIASAITELQEAHYHYSHYLDKLESNPTRLKIVEERLSAINDVKRKYSCAFEDLEKLSHELQTKHTQIKEATEKRDLLASKLTAQRQAAAKTLSQKLTQKLQSLGMPKASIEIKCTPSELTITGKDNIQFILSPNPGEAQIPLHTHASGGELSRVMLALKLLDTNTVSTFIFDEIDSNIGGETASSIGLKLKTLGEKSQVICITHFPQVAKCADHHLQITKKEENGRTITEIKTLNDNSPELLRMLGGQAFTKKF